MVQPRKEQIKSVNVRHATARFTAFANASVTAVSVASLSADLVSDQVGGSQDPVPAYVLGTLSEAFTIIASDSFSIRVDNGSVNVVTFTGTDVGSSRICNRINTTAGVPAGTARNMEGRVLLASATVGATSSIVLADVVPGTLAKLGMAAGTYTGSNDPRRGIVTASPDFLGGFCAARGPDGRPLVTDAPFVRIGPSATLPSDVRAPDVPSGIPVHARLTAQGTNLRFAWHAMLPTRGSTTSFNADFAALDGTDSVTLGLNGLPTFTVTFPSAPYTATTVCDAINAAAAAAYCSVGPALGAARVRGEISQPYGLSGTSMAVALDGASLETVVSFSNEVTAAQVATRIQTVIGAGIVAVAATDSGQNSVVDLRSANADGRTSSIRIRGNALQALGLVAGTYRGFWMADLYGTSDIRIQTPTRSSTGSVSVSGPAQSLARLGLTAGSYNNSSVPAPEPVRMPFMANQVGAVIPSHSVFALIPEALEFGEVPAGTDSLLSQFDENTAGGDNVRDMSYGATAVASTAPLSATSVDPGGGTRYAGRPLILGPDGQVPKQFLGRATAESSKIFKKIVRGDHATGRVDALVASIIEVPGTAGNPVPGVATMTMDLDPSEAFGFPSFVVRFNRDTNPLTVFSVDQDNSYSGMDYLVQTRVQNAAFANMTGNLRFADAATSNVGLADGAQEFMALTSSANLSGAEYVRIGEVNATSTRKSDMSLVGKMNSPWSVTCGDGTSSFGDFSGPNAIQQAVAFMNANVSSTVSFRILLKRGNYVVSVANGSIAIPAGRNLTIQGESEASTLITVTDGIASPMTLDVGSVVHLRDLTFRKTLINSDSGRIFGGTSGNSFFATNVRFQEIRLFLTDPASYRIRDCTFANGSSYGNQPVIWIRLGDGGVHEGPFIAEDCTFQSPENMPPLRVSANNGSSPLTNIDNIRFVRCQIDLRSTTTASGNMLGNPGVLHVDPAGSNALAGTVGVHIRRVEWKDCNVRANVNGAPISVLIHVMPNDDGDQVEWLSIGRLTIDGGRWTCPNVNSTYAPFVVAGIGEANYYSSNTAAFGPDRGALEIRDVVMGWNDVTPVNYGLPTANMSSLFAEGGAISQADWAAFALHGQNIEIQNWTIVNPTQLSGAGEILIRRSRLSIDGLKVLRYILGGPSTTPSARMRLRARNGQSRDFAKVRDVRFDGQSATVGDWGGAILLLEPWSSGTPTDGNQVELDDVYISGFRTNSGVNNTTASGIILNATAVSAYYPGSPSDAHNLFIRRCEVRNCSLGIGLLAANAGQSTSNFHVNDCTLVANTIRGLLWSVSGGATCRNLEFRGNRVTNNLTNPAVSFEVFEWGSTSNGEAHVICTGNTVADNGTATNSQIWLIPSGNNAQPQGTFRDNICVYAGTMGTIKARTTNGGGTATAFPATATVIQLPVRGLETGYSTASNVTRTYGDGLFLYHNVAVLETP